MDNLADIKTCPLHTGSLTGTGSRIPLPLALRVLGCQHQTDWRAYQWDNTRRQHFVLYQHTLAGEGRFTDTTGRHHPIPAGTGFLCRCPSPTSYGLKQDHNWHFLFAIMTGPLAHQLTRTLLQHHGPLFEPHIHATGLSSLAELIRRSADGLAIDSHQGSTVGYHLLMDLGAAAGTLAPAPEPLARAHQFLLDHLHEPTLDLDQLAEHAHMSRYHFCRRFAQVYGRPPAQYLNVCRLERAMQIITGSDLPLKTISGQCGFTDHAYFCRRFKQYFGMTPGSIGKRQK